MDVSIIIPVRDNPSGLTALLESLAVARSAGFAIETIIADDGSAVPVTGLCMGHDAHCVRLQGVGPAAARNAAAAQATGDLLLFLDSDVVYPRGLLEAAKEVLDAEPSLSAVSFGNQAYAKGDPWVSNFGAAIEHYWFSAYFAGDATLGAFPGVTTRNMVIRRAVFEELHGFNAFYKTNAIEDYDFGKRLIAGHKSVLMRTPEPYHAFPDTIGRVLRNYYVRAALFVPYFMQHRPALDKAQTSGDEALLRLVGSGSVLAALLVLPPSPARPALAALALLGLGLYTWRLRGFLLAAAQSSGTWLFAGQCLFLHILSSVAITVGGLRGLAATVFERIGSKQEVSP